MRTFRLLPEPPPWPKRTVRPKNGGSSGCMKKDECKLSKLDLKNPSVSSSALWTVALSFLSSRAAVTFLICTKTVAVDEAGGCRWKNASPTITLSLGKGRIPSTTLPFVIPSEAEGSAVPRTNPGNAEYDAQTGCHLVCSGPNDKGVRCGRARPTQAKRGLAAGD